MGLRGRVKDNWTGITRTADVLRGIASVAVTLTCSVYIGDRVTQHFSETTHEGRDIHFTIIVDDEPVVIDAPEDVDSLTYTVKTFMGVPYKVEEQKK